MFLNIIITYDIIVLMFT